jgi:hypothetical protein
MEKMKARFPLAIAEPVDVFAVHNGDRPPCSRDRTHVFDFEDGMRMVVSIDEVVESRFMHVSASGSPEYANSIKDEGLKGMIEDVVLRLAALQGHAPARNLQARFTSSGVLHIIFEIKDGPDSRGEGAGVGDSPCD